MFSPKTFSTKTFSPKTFKFFGVDEEETGDTSAAKLLFPQQFDIERDDLEIIKMVINFLNLIR